MEVPYLTADEMQSIQDLNATFRTIREMFEEQQGYPALMRAAVSAIRDSADVLEGLAARWEDDVFRS